ncbi:glucose-6-phosphate dehydrogenase [Candidatus Babeliales bacterium]|nr:glucose-6-phosphate dehydrogenase [Candidatus Babeliales bacterium]
MVHQHCFDECTFVIFGATGDLSKRKLIPAIYKLVQDRRLCKFTIIGISIDQTDEKKIIEQATKFIVDPQADILTTLVNSFHYYQMDFSNKKAYANLKNFLEKFEHEQKLPKNRLFYFATMPEHFIDITKGLVKHNIVQKKETATKTTDPWSRVVYEKPFGHNLKSSQKINRYLADVFNENQIYRIDHFLGKELVGNIALARFTNRIFEPLWNNNHIENVHIVLNEKIGVEGRGAYYDANGAIKDMVQSHVLQLLALTAMEAPDKLGAASIRNAKATVLKKVQIDKVIRGQYEGYLKEKNVSPRSKTETFIAIKALIDNKRWRGVPFYLTTGKCMPIKESYIQVNFKKAECLLSACPSESNYFRINIEPNEGFYLSLNAKVPGKANEVTPVTMELPHARLLGPNTPEAYEVLIADIMKGDQSAFVRGDEVQISWKIVEQIDKAHNAKLYSYPQGSTGPHEVKKIFSQK